MLPALASTAPAVVLDSFPQFGKLPLELRLRIWELLLDRRPRIVLLREELEGDAGGVVNFTSRLLSLKNRQEDLKEFRRQRVDEMRRRNGTGFNLNAFEYNFRIYRNDLFSIDSENTEEELAELRLLEEFETAADWVSDSERGSDGIHQDRICRRGTLVSKTSNFLTPSKWRLKSMCRLPSYVYTCKESFLITRAGKNTICTNGSAKSNFYFNFEVDTLYLDSRSFLEKCAANGIKSLDPYLRYDLRNIDKCALAKVKRLALDWDDWWGQERSLSWMLGYFPGVDTITMVVDDSKIDFDSSDLCFTSLRPVDETLYEYGKEVRWDSSVENDVYSLGNKYQRMFGRDDFELKLKEEMGYRLAGINQRWEISEILVQTLSDISTEDRITKAQEACCEALNRAWRRLDGLPSS